MNQKTVYKKVRKLTVGERAYIAGIIDGEGSVTLTVKQKGGTRHLGVTVSNTELPLLEYLLEVVGAGKITSKRIYQKHHTPSYTYAVYNRQALDLLRQLLPYLRTYKLRRAQLALEKYVLVTPRNGKYSDEARKTKEEFIEEFLAITSKPPKKSS